MTRSAWRRFKLWMTWDTLKEGVDYRLLPPECKGEHNWIEDRCVDCEIQRVKSDEVD